MKRFWKTNKQVPKPEDKQMEKFKSNRKYNIRAGLPQDILSRLKEIYEFLTIKDAMDAQGFIKTGYDELKQVSRLSNAYLTTLIRERLVLKKSTGERRSFKYKWDSIYPTLDMAVMTIEKTYAHLHGEDKASYEITEETLSDKEDDNVDPESMKIQKADSEIKIVPEEEKDKYVSLIDYRTEGDIMTVRVNLKQFKVEEADVIAAVMALLAGK